jgi:hypothetical protein
MLSTLKGLGLECHQLTPDFDGIEEFLRHRYNYWTDDLPHSDPFIISKKSAVREKRRGAVPSTRRRLSETMLIVCENEECSNTAYAFMSGDALCCSCIDARSEERADKSRKPFIIELGRGMPPDMMGGARMTTKIADVICPDCLLKVVELFKG